MPVNREKLEEASGLLERLIELIEQLRDTDGNSLLQKNMLDCSLFDTRRIQRVIRNELGYADKEKLAEWRRNAKAKKKPAANRNKA
jgi:hypothetical protein